MGGGVALIIRRRALDGLVAHRDHHGRLSAQTAVPARRLPRRRPQRQRRVDGLRGRVCGERLRDAPLHGEVPAADEAGDRSAGCGAGLPQTLGDVIVTFARRQHPRRPAALRLGIRPRAVAQEQPHHLAVAGAGGDVQGGPLIVRRRIGVHAHAQQPLDDDALAGPGRLRARRPIGDRGRVGLPAVAPIDHRRSCLERVRGEIGALKFADWTALAHAARNGQGVVVERLLGMGVDANATSDDKWTALHVAARAGHREVVRLLLGHGARSDAKTESGWTPWMLAAREGHDDVAQSLREAGAAAGGAVAGLVSGWHLAVQGRITEALTAYAAAQAIDSTLALWPAAWQTACWHGGLSGQAAVVIAMCDKAAERTPAEDRSEERRVGKRVWEGWLGGEGMGKLDI